MPAEKRDHRPKNGFSSRWWQAFVAAAVSIVAVGVSYLQWSTQATLLDLEREKQSWARKQAEAEHDWEQKRSLQEFLSSNKDAILSGDERQQKLIARTLRATYPSSLVEQTIQDLVVTASTLEELETWYAVSREYDPARSRILVLDTNDPERTYNCDYIANEKTNADEIGDVLAPYEDKFRVIVGRVIDTWDNYDVIVDLEPDLVIIHRNAFNESYGHEERLVRLFAHMSELDEPPSFLVYSRAFNGGDEQDVHWLEGVKKRIRAYCKDTSITYKGDLTIQTFGISGTAESVPENCPLETVWKSFTHPDTVGVFSGCVLNLLKAHNERF